MGIFLEARYVHVAAAFGAPEVAFMPLQLGMRFGGYEADRPSRSASWFVPALAGVMFVRRG